MALRSDKSLSALGQRLYGLMDERGLKSPKELAKKLYELGLVHVKTRENFNNWERDRDNAVLSIEKKIVRHIKTGVISDQQGEYILAYSKFFGCSSDYVLGLTDIKSANIGVRHICEMLGLSEKVIVNLMTCQQENNYLISGCWSILMESPLLRSIPEDMVSMGEELRLMYQNESNAYALRWERTMVNGPDLMDIDQDIEGQEQEARSRRSAFYGRLMKTSRDCSEVLEQHLMKAFAPFKEKLFEATLQETKKRYR